MNLFPKANRGMSDAGWTFDTSFIQSIQDSVNANGEDASAEAIESVLLWLEDNLFKIGADCEKLSDELLGQIIIGTSTGFHFNYPAISKIMAKDILAERKRSARWKKAAQKFYAISQAWIGD